MSALDYLNQIQDIVEEIKTKEMAKIEEASGLAVLENFCG
jgi:hypothetical protein